MVTAETYRINEMARMRILLGGLSASMCLGTFYGFNLLSNYMQITYGFTAKDLTAITTTALVVSFVTFPNGMLLDYAGPMYVCALACLLNSVGALLFGLAFQGYIAASTVRFAVFCAIFNLGCTSFDTGSLMAVLGSFPLSKGLIVGTMKTLGGLSSTVLAVVQYSFFRTQYAAYMYFMAGLIFFLGIVSAVFIRFPPYHIMDCELTRVPRAMQQRRRLTEYAYITQRPPMRRVYLGFIIILILFVYLVTQSLCVAYVPSVTDRDRLAITVVALCIVASLGLVAAPLPFLGGMNTSYSTEYPELPPWYCDAEEGNDSSKEEHHSLQRHPHPQPPQDHGYLDDDDDNNDSDGQQRAPYAQAKLSGVANAVRDDGGNNDDSQADKTTSGEGTSTITREAYENAIASQRVSSLDPPYQGSFWSHLKTVDLWLIFWNTFAVWGCGMVITMNSAQIYRALDNDRYEMKTNTLYSSIIGIGNGLGRISMGVFEYILVRHDPVSRPAVTAALPVSSVCMVIGVLLLIVVPEGSKTIIIGFFFDAFGNGFSWACNAIIMRSIYAHDIGKHYNFMYAAACISVIALNRFGYGELYDRRAQHQAAEGKFTPSIYPRCGGKMCVRDSLIILVCVNFTAIIGSTLCHIRYRRFVARYRSEIARANEDGGSRAPTTDTLVAANEAAARA